MSGGEACRCSGPAKEKRKNWSVIQRNCNHSAFNGYRQTYSDYSSVRCSCCNRVWRTKASFVDSLPDYKL